MDQRLETQQGGVQERNGQSGEESDGESQERTGDRDEAGIHEGKGEERSGTGRNFPPPSTQGIIGKDYPTQKPDFQ